MSQIFDALQRLEAERSGIELSALPEATELLRRAELEVATQWEREVLSGRRDTVEGSEPDSFEIESGLVNVVTQKTPVAIEISSSDESLDVFGLFQSLPISPPLCNRLVCAADGDNRAAEAFRLLGVRLRHLRRDRPLRKLLITSTIPQEGKSMVAANLACTLAQRKQQKVLLLEGDVRRPSLSQMFGLGRNPGICEWLKDGHSLVANIYHLEEPSLYILPAGNTSNNSLEFLQSGKLSALMEQLTAWFDWIIIDSPPVLPIADTSIWMRLADGIILVARQGITETGHLKKGLEALESKKVIGVLLNGCKHSSHNDYYYETPADSKQTSGSDI
jgi:capsular exopolysaccharide synthesis family protein